mgnify:FL=1
MSGSQQSLEVLESVDGDRLASLQERMVAAMPDP